MAYTTGDELNQLQSDVLWESIADNPLLAEHAIASLDKSLKTTNKRIIKAINEVLTESNKSLEAVNGFTSRFNLVLGDEITDPTLLDKIYEIDTNFFNAIYKIYKDLETQKGRIDALETNGGGSGETVDLTPINEAIQELSDRLDELDALKFEVHEDKINELDGQTFTLTYFPRLASSISLYVNGVYYNSNYYSISEKTITWLFTEAEGGFDLTSEFDVTVKYDYVLATNQ